MTAANGRFSGQSFLFLQGMASTFFQELGAALSARGHTVRRIAFNGGDLVFWPNGEGGSYRGSVRGFAAFLEPRLVSWAVTDIVLFGDCRPLHQVAVQLAKVRNIRIHVVEEGYLRPNWITLEAGGVNGHSALPREPTWYLDAATKTAPWTGGLPVSASFSRRAIEDVVYNVSSVLLSPLYPGYRTHRPWHPFVEYVGWVKQLFTKDRKADEANKSVSSLIDGGRPYYVHPLQLDCDSQIRHHSSFGRIAPALEYVIASFARAAPPDSLLVIKEHPLDNGLQDWLKLTKRLGAAYQVYDRIVFIVGGDLERLVSGSSGVVTVNSTVGFVALSLGKPVIALADAIYAMKGLTFDGQLDAFWTQGEPGQAHLFEAVRSIVASKTQINGGFFSKDGLTLAVDNSVNRLEAACESPT